MATTIKMPQLGESVTEGTIERWLVKVGDSVAQYDPLFEVVTDKVNAEVPAEVGGVVTNILVGDGQTVKVGTPLAEITENGEGRRQPPKRSRQPSPWPRRPSPPSPLPGRDRRTGARGTARASEAEPVVEDAAPVAEAAPRA